MSPFLKKMGFGFRLVVDSRFVREGKGVVMKDAYEIAREIERVMQRQGVFVNGINGTTTYYIDDKTTRIDYKKLKRVGKEMRYLLLKRYTQQQLQEVIQYWKTFSYLSENKYRIVAFFTGNWFRDLIAGGEYGEVADGYH